MSTVANDQWSLCGLFTEFQLCPDTSIKILAIFGALFLTKILFFSLWEFLKIIRQYGLTSISYDKDFPSRYNGKWAVVTGASEGLGQGYAFELARRKMNVILISRSLTKLQKTSDYIEKIYGVETVCIPFDLCLLKQGTPYKALKNQLSKYDISVLINNVGYLTETLQPHLEMEMSDVLAMQDLNMGAPSLMTHMLLPRLLEKKNGAIINVSSIVSMKPTPYMGMYSSTKIFLDYFTQCLAFEYKGRGITFQHVNPGYISTRMTNYAKCFGIVANPRSCADFSLRNLGVTLQTSGHIVHHVAAIIACLLPKFVWLQLMQIHNIAWSWLTGRKVKYF